MKYFTFSFCLESSRIPKSDFVTPEDAERDHFNALSEGEQNQYLEDQLRLYRTSLPSGYYSTFIQNFKESFEAVRKQHEKCSGRELKRLSRKLLFTQIRNCLEPEMKLLEARRNWAQTMQYDALIGALMYNDVITDDVTMNNNELAMRSPFASPRPCVIPHGDRVSPCKYAVFPPTPGKPPCDLTRSLLLTDILDAVDSVESKMKQKSAAPTVVKSLSPTLAKIRDAVRNHARDIDDAHLTLNGRLLRVPALHNTNLENRILYDTIRPELVRLAVDNSNRDLEMALRTDTDLTLPQHVLDDLMLSMEGADNLHDVCRSPSCLLTNLLVAEMAGLQGPALECWFEASGINEMAKTEN